eukprot:CAMPEP_0172523860 /NCGR_PEP_ID=MMETSP1066-20121228/293879_1 /TAXON_ID=671091 /ORGANISM="Coscinodiscus wailesii, Strain CCMP2513" /LENGTH=470 /DNA_ID=CAMNT_0013306955 /DNA_START=3300 /DNA_END=4709 /DNA_ORIENTATION=-
MRGCRTGYRVQMQAAIIVQQQYRSWKNSLELERMNAATLIQSRIRMFFRRVNAKKALDSVVSIQAFARMVAATSKYKVCIAAIVCLQRVFRRLNLKNEILKDAAAREIQRVWRGYVVVVYVNQVVYSVTLVQAVVRSVLLRRMMSQERDSAVRIQSRYRSVLAERTLAHLKYEKVCNDAKYKKRCIAAGIIQAVVRTFLYQKKLVVHVSTAQRFIRGALVRRRVNKIKTGIVSIQSRFRGQRVRKQRSRRVAKAAMKILKANQKAKLNPKLRLGVRTTYALKILQRSKRLTEIIRAVSILEISTRLSINCCAAFVQARAPEILYALVRTCNRSLPHIELLHYVLLTLTNVAVHRKFIQGVASGNAIDILMDMIQMFRDKEFIFCLAIQLIETFCINDRRLLAKCGSKENVKRLKGIRAIFLRQAQTDKKGQRYLKHGSSKIQPNNVKSKVSNGFGALDRILKILYSNGMI